MVILPTVVLGFQACRASGRISLELRVEGGDRGGLGGAAGDDTQIHRSRAVNGNLQALSLGRRGCAGGEGGVIEVAGSARHALIVDVAPETESV